MKITKSQLKQIIKEEVSNILAEKVVDASIGQDISLMVRDARQNMRDPTSARHYAKRLYGDLGDISHKIAAIDDGKNRDLHQLSKKIREVHLDTGQEIEEGAKFDEGYLKSLHNWLNEIVSLATRVGI
jgi:hypothetical protein